MVICKLQPAPVTGSQRKNVSQLVGGIGHVTSSYGTDTQSQAKFPADRWTDGGAA